MVSKVWNLQCYESDEHQYDSRIEPFTNCFAGLSELERNLINERTEEGRASAKKRGVKFERKFKLTSHQRDQVRTMLKDGQSIRAIARHFNVGIATIDRIKQTMTLSSRSCRFEPLRAYKMIRFAVIEAFVRTGPISVHDPVDPMGKMFFNILATFATFAEFEADLIRMRTREGMAIARAKGKLRGKKPKLSEKQQNELIRIHASGEYSISDLAELFSVSRPTVYRTLDRAKIA